MNKTLVLLFSVGIVFLFSCTGGDNTAQKPEVSAPAVEPATETTTPAESAPATSSSTEAKMGTATITGKVKFEGEAPKPRPINMSADKVCKSQHKSDIFNEDVVVASDGGMKWIFVYIKEGISAKYPAPAEPAVIDQKGCVYLPHVMGIMVGQKVQIKNSDPLLHNIHATPSVNAEFNKGQPKQGAMDEVMFDKMEIMVPFKCDVHPWMSAKANILEHPFFAVTMDDGMFSIKNVPAGTYTLAAVSEKFSEKTAQITVTDGGSITQDFSFSK